MSNYLESEIVAASRKLCYSPVKRTRKRILKSKENILKSKCNKELKRKLKKYKLRRDGIEDPDVLDVSQILVTSLRIKSPNNQDKIYYNNNTIESQDLNPTNYLIKMVRRKKTSLDIKSLGCVKGSDIIKNDQKPLNVLSDTEEHKHQMDAFKLMMDSRNKSIGSNSPGKEKTDEPESKEHFDKKENRAKRILSLQKMALSKGAIQNEEIEEYRERCINKKLLKRAEKFKDMLTKTEGKSKKKLRLIETSKIQSKPVDVSEQKCTSVNLESLNLCNILDETRLLDYAKTSTKKVEEDSDFLQKLSPSLKKTENMLCYFKKISKEENNQFEQIENNSEIERNDSIVKKMLLPKNRKKTKRNDSSENISESLFNIDNSIDSKEKTINSDDRYKRKRNIKIEKSFQCQSSSLKNTDIIQNRPKRHAKKPIKYTEDVHTFSSDEELHIFTPKKKKTSEQYSNAVEVVATIQASKNNHNVKYSKEIYKAKERNTNAKLLKKDQNFKSKFDKKFVSNHQKCAGTSTDLSKKKIKLAPIFASKTQLSSADVEAKQKFLNSGVPEKLKRKLEQPINYVSFDIFPPVVHVQQINCEWSIYEGKDWSEILNIVDVFDDANSNQYSFKSLLTLEGINNLYVPIIKQKSEKVLKNIKSAYPKFPVYRTYHLLKGKSQGLFKECSYPNLDNSIEIINDCMEIDNENPDKLNWCDKYKPTSSKHIIGNFEGVKELKRWLETWTENLVKQKNTTCDSSDSSDFYHSDTDSRDTAKNTNNVLILTGQTGSGKTSSVYAVASELAIKVIEVNASSKRTGKRVLQELQEATQSHKVDRGKSGSEGSQKLEEQLINKKRVKSKTMHKKKKNTKTKPQLSQHTTHEVFQAQITASQDNIRTGMSLILIDDADIIFEQDDGFCSAISQLVQTSKRPVILSTSSLTCIHLQRFLQNGKILHMHPLLPRMLGTWLDIMCLADVGICYSGLGAKLLDLYKGDMRKTINYLQFYMNSNKYMNQAEDIAKSNLALSQGKYSFDDENSSISWADSENLDIPNDMDAESNVDEHLQALHSNVPLDMFNIWWSFLTNFTENAKIDDHRRHVREDNTNINRLAEIIDTMSIIDFYDQKAVTGLTNIATKPWHGSETASLLDNENFDCYRKNHLVAEEISNVLMKSAIVGAEKALNHKLKICAPSMSIQRTRDKVVSRHITLSSYLNPSAVLDRRAAALDYWPACRTICRIEKSRTDSNLKRNNRFCHYLKSLNILCKNVYFDALADSLS